MRKLSKMIIAAIILVSIIFTSIIVTASEYTDTLRVGIYYDSAAVLDLTIGSDNGFSIGIVKDRKLIPVVSVAGSSVQVDKVDSEASHYVMYSSHSTAEEAKAALEELETKEIDAFLGYINSSYSVICGSFKNNNDALWAAENLAVKGKPFNVSSKAVILKDDVGETMFLVDDLEFGLSVYSNDYDDTDKLLTISGSAKGTYRGGFEVKSLDGKTLTVVNVVPVEEYLYSVVCREMSSSWEVEALKAQAVCARNFALGRINYHKKYGFDVCRTVCCQAYSTSADNSESVHTAVDETRGELLFYEDELVQAVYSSSMGKRTENVENVWGSKFPYLVSVDNPYEDTENIYNGKWTKTLTKARATEIMAARGYNVGDVTSISVLERTPADSVLKLKVSGTKGDKVFERESCRTIFSEATYSQRYTVTSGGQTIHPQINITDGKNTKTVSTDSVVVIGKDGKTSSLNSGCIIYDGKTKKEYQATKTGGDPDSFVFSGEGWGHGVGMSQYGAKGMAAAGFKYDEILTHYYTGTHIEKAY